MLNWVFTFLVLALLSALFGFAGLAALSIEVARLLFFVFIILFIVTTLVHLLGSGRTPSLDL
ncbi:MAG TPA: DUF1328 domain-containing protein [Patescibacteria group bacterium]|nr:DUF1328 domain-containing protein [Patescibacteria group bacterium]